MWGGICIYVVSTHHLATGGLVLKVFEVCSYIGSPGLPFSPRPFPLECRSVRCPLPVIVPSASCQRDPWGLGLTSPSSRGPPSGSEYLPDKTFTDRHTSHYMFVIVGCKTNALGLVSIRRHTGPSLFCIAMKLYVTLVHKSTTNQGKSLQEEQQTNFNLITVFIAWLAVIWILKGLE